LSKEPNMATAKMMFFVPPSLGERGFYICEDMDP
jgi:hypothetical protein